MNEFKLGGADCFVDLEQERTSRMARQMAFLVADTLREFKVGNLMLLSSISAGLMSPLPTNITNFGETAVASRLGYDIVFVSEVFLN